MCNGGGGEGEKGIGLCGEYLQKLYTVYSPDSEPTNLLYHPKQKPMRGGGLRQINNCGQIPLQVNFKKIRSLGFGVFIVIWSMYGM